jgi:hypothetical protein
MAQVGRVVNADLLAGLSRFVGADRRVRHGSSCPMSVAHASLNRPVRGGSGSSIPVVVGVRESGLLCQHGSPGGEGAGVEPVVEQARKALAEILALEDKDDRVSTHEDAVSREPGAAGIEWRASDEQLTCPHLGTGSQLARNGNSVDVTSIHDARAQVIGPCADSARG